MNGSQTGYRREVLASGATVLVPAWASVSAAETASGEVELSVTSTVPTDTSASIRVYEDLDADGIQEHEQEVSLSGGTETFQLSSLDGEEGNGVEYWLELSLSTNDGSVTPEVDTATLTLPGETQQQDTPEEPIGLLEYLSNLTVFLVFSVIVGGAIGLLSRSFAVAAFAAFLFFVHIAIETSQPLFVNVLYIVLVAVLMGAGYQVYSFYAGGD